MSSAKHIVLTTHPRQVGVNPFEIKWGAATAEERGPIIATTANPGVRNSIGCHSGSYGIYRAVSVAMGALNKDFVPDFTNTLPYDRIEYNPAWSDTKKICAIDPWGHMIADKFRKQLDAGIDIRPTIAITKAHINIPEIVDLMKEGKLKADNWLLKENGAVIVTKAALDPVWYLPEVAKRFGTTEAVLRKTLFEETAGMYPELITRSDLNVFLPPIGGMTAYVFGPLERLQQKDVEVSVRVHDECNGSDVFGSDICTCRPYLAHGIQVCIETAQKGGVGVIVYFRKEGRCLGEVTKFLVYNARKRQEGGDRAETYFRRTECVAGVQDARFQALMPDVLHWLGITRIDRLVSMSDMKYDAIVGSGIEVKERIPIPDDMIPEDSRVEIDAKIYAGYFSPQTISIEELQQKKGKDWS